MTIPRWLAALLLATLCAASHAQGMLLKLPTRDGITTNVWWEPVDGARATVLLFPGGGGGFGKVDSGQPSSRNFLVRSLQHFRAAGLSVRHDDPYRGGATTQRYGRPAFKPVSNEEAGKA